jgi:hypothetical protein
MDKRYFGDTRPVDETKLRTSFSPNFYDKTTSVAMNEVMSLDLWGECSATEVVLFVGIR